MPVDDVRHDPAQQFPHLAATPQGESALPLLLGKRRATGRTLVLTVVWLAVGVLLGLVSGMAHLTRTGIWVGIICLAGSVACGAIAVAMVRRLIVDRLSELGGLVFGVVVFCVVFLAPLVVFYVVWWGRWNAELNAWWAAAPWLTLPGIGVVFMCAVGAVMVALAGIGEAIGAMIDRRRP